MALHHTRLQQTARYLLGLVLACWCMGPAATVPLADTSLPLSQVVWQPEKNLQFLGSPAIALLANGSYLASHDDYGPKAVIRRICLGHSAVCTNHHEHAEHACVGPLPPDHRCAGHVPRCVHCALSCFDTATSCAPAGCSHDARLHIKRQGPELGGGRRCQGAVLEQPARARRGRLPDRDSVRWLRRRPQRRDLKKR